MLSHTHAHTCSYTQTGHFPGAFHDNIHQWEEGNHNGLDWYRLLAERCWKFHFWWRKQLDTKKTRTAGKPATGQRTMRWPTHWIQTELRTRCRHLHREPWRPLVFLWLVTSGNTAVHLMAFHMSIALTLSVIYTVQWRTTAVAWAKNTPTAC